MSTKYSFSQPIEVSIGGNRSIRLSSDRIAPLLAILGDGVSSAFSVHGAFALDMADQNQTISASNSANTQFRLHGTMTAPRDLTLSVAHGNGAYKWIENQTSQDITVKFSTGAGVVVPHLSSAKVYSDGSALHVMLLGTVDFETVKNALGQADSAIDFNGQQLKNIADGSDDQDAVTYKQLQAAILGLDAKDPVETAATANRALSGLHLINAYQLKNGDRVLLTAQNTATENGIWIAHSGAWTRPADFAVGQSATGAFVFVQHGNLANFGYWCLSKPAVIGTDPLTFTQFTGATTLQAGNGISIEANVISAVSGDSSIVVDGDGIKVGEISDVQHGSRSGGNLHSEASAMDAGFMSAADFSKLAGIPSDAVSSQRRIDSGDGLTGGGDLSVDRTLAVVAADGSIVVSGAGVAVGVISDMQHGDQPGGTLHALVNGSEAGFMSPEQAMKLDGIAEGATNTPLGTGPILDVGTEPSAGTSFFAAREDHVHALIYSTAQYAIGAADSDLSLNNQKLINVGAATELGDALVYDQTGAQLEGLSLTANLEMQNSSKITGLGAAANAGEAISYGQSGAQLADLSIMGELDMHSHKVTNVASASANGDALAYGQSGAKLAGLDSTGDITMNSHKLTSLAAASASGQAIVYAQTNASLQGLNLTDALDMNSHKVVALASASAAGDALAFGQSGAELAGAKFTANVDLDSHKIVNLATPTASGDAASKGYVDGKASNASPENIALSASSGTSADFSRADHAHDLPASVLLSVLGEISSSADFNAQQIKNAASIQIGVSAKNSTDYVMTASTAGSSSSESSELVMLDSSQLSLPANKGAMISVDLVCETASSGAVMYSAKLLAVTNGSGSITWKSYSEVLDNPADLALDVSLDQSIVDHVSIKVSTSATLKTIAVAKVCVVLMSKPV